MSGLIELSNSAARWLKVGSKRGVSSIEYGTSGSPDFCRNHRRRCESGDKPKRSVPDDCSHAASVVTSRHQIVRKSDGPIELAGQSDHSDDVGKGGMMRLRMDGEAPVQPRNPAARLAREIR